MASRLSTPSEGEIVDSSSNKAKSRSPSFSSTVNRQSRRPVRYSRSPSPNASDHRSQRSRQDDQYYGSSSRRFRDHPDSRRHARNDRYRRSSRERYDRRRSRSPPRFSDGHDIRRSRENEYRNKERREQSVSNRSDAPSAAANSRASAEISESHTQQEYRAAEITDDVPGSAEPLAPVDLEALREEKRRKWEAIRAKHQSRPNTPLLVRALDSPATPGPGKFACSETFIGAQYKDAPHLAFHHPKNFTDSLETEPATPKSTSSRSPTPMDFSKDSELANHHENGDGRDEGPSAADYDPTQDMQDDKLKHDQRLQGASGAEQATAQEGKSETSHEQAKAAKPKDEFDMFADDDDDDDDMFASNPPANAKELDTGKAMKMNTMDDWDDEEGYYKIILGELLDDRYHVQSNLGRGMFSGVVRAQDQVTKKLVAIKLIRSNEIMTKAAAKEIDILEKLKSADPEDKRHVVRLERSFEHKGHLCMVFENLHENLREVLKKFGRDVGIELQAVRVYAQQIFKGLGLLRKCNILHADLKPDNILVNDRRNWLKICDLGSASDATDSEITPYLVSRFYRAPEIILGMPYEFGIDTWSIGCTLYELYTGKILFTGRSNNQMLRAFMECRGRIPTRMLKRSEFAHMHFDESGIFRSVEKDRVTGKDIIKMQNYLKPTRDLRARLSTKGLSDSETKELNLFIDLLDKCLIFNPEKRITPTDALKHPFITRLRA